MSNIPFQVIDWKNIVKTMHPGDTGTASWQTLQFEGLRVRIVEYSAGYFNQQSAFTRCAFTTEDQ